MGRMGDGEEVGESILLQQWAFMMPSVWRVYIAHRELTGYKAAVVGSVSSPGLLGLVQLVTRALVGLRIPGLYNSEGLMPKKGSPVRVKPGEFVCMSRFLANIYVPGVPPPPTLANDFHSIQGDINLVEETDPPDPMDRFESTLDE